VRGGAPDCRRRGTTGSRGAREGAPGRAPGDRDGDGRAGLTSPPPAGERERERMTGIPGMAVPVFTVVNVGLAMTLLGGGLLLLIALWWTVKGDGIGIPRSRGPAPVRRGGAAGWVV